MIVYIIDKYLGDGTHGNPFRPAATDAFSGAWDSVIDQPESIAPLPDPNVIVVQIIGNDSLITLIENHPDYGVGAILYDVPNPYSATEKPSPNEFGKRRSYCAKNKIDNETFRQLFGTQTDPFIRIDGANNLEQYIKSKNTKNP